MQDAQDAQDEDEDEELLDELYPDHQIVHAAAVQASTCALSEPDTHLLHPTTQEISLTDAGARPQWGVPAVENVFGDDNGDDRVALGHRVVETNWRICLADRNGQFMVCGRGTSRRNMLQAVLSPAAVMLLMVLTVVVWLVRGSSAGSSNGSVSGL